ncbi:MAG: flagellar basal body-associated FliL family protein [Janthinobacterium lividum]
MSAATTTDVAADKPAKGGKKKLMLMVLAPLLLVGVGAGVWFSGLLGGHKVEPKVEKAEAAKPMAPVFVEMPEIVANLNAGPKRNSFIKLKVKLEAHRPEDVAAINAAMPRLLDLFQTYLRETRPEELRGSASTYRLREELLNRAEDAVAPGHVSDVLFTDLLIQ